LPESATSEGTRRFQASFEGKLAPGHFREVLGLRLSSIGLGTYLGDPDAQTDRRYVESVLAYFARGGNVVDTAVNYRFQRSERAVGEALRRAFADGKHKRDEIFVATKGGYLAYDGAFPADPGDYFHRRFEEPGIADFDDLVAGCHCMTPAFLRDSIETSLSNLGLTCLDLYLLHNPEDQLGEVQAEQVLERIAAAFAELEKAVSAGKIRAYGVATWKGLRVPPERPEHLSLESLLAAARQAGGSRHHFRAVQAPFHLLAPEAAVEPTQKVGKETLPLLRAVEKLGLAFFGSAPLAQGKLAREAPPWVADTFPDLKSSAQRAVQFVRSTPGVGVVIAGMSRVSHVDEILRLGASPPLDADAGTELLARVS